MKIKELKQLLTEYSDDAIVQIAVSDHANVLNLQSIGIDDEYEKDDALVLTVSIDEDEPYYFEHDRE